MWKQWKSLDSGLWAFLFGCNPQQQNVVPCHIDTILLIYFANLLSDFYIIQDSTERLIER